MLGSLRHVSESVKQASSRSIRDRAEASLVAAAFALPSAVKRRITGPPVVIEGNTLDADAHLLLTLAKTRPLPSHSTDPQSLAAARANLTRTAIMMAAGPRPSTPRRSPFRVPTARFAPGSTSRQPTPALCSSISTAAGGYRAASNPTMPRAACWPKPPAHGSSRSTTGSHPNSLSPHRYTMPMPPTSISSTAPTSSAQTRRASLSGATARAGIFPQRSRCVPATTARPHRRRSC